MADRLTVQRIAAASPRAQRYILNDDLVPGFGVRVTPNGAKSWALRYRLKSKKDAAGATVRDGRQRCATMGKVGPLNGGGGQLRDVLTLEDARDRARAYIGVLATGEDPLRRIDLARRAPTVNDAADRFLEDHVDVRLKPGTRRLYHLALDRHIRTRLGTLAVGEVTRADVGTLHRRLTRGGSPILANRVVAVLSKLLTWAMHNGFATEGPNPCRGLLKNREQPRRRYLTPSELQRVGAALRIAERCECMSLIAVTAIRLLLLTGARCGEILSLKWREVDLTRAELRLQDSKTGRKTIVLNSAAAEILREWPRHASSAYVFPGEGRGWRKGQHRVNLTDAWGWIRRRARIPDVRLHDLRHSFASIAVSSGQTLPIVGALLGHTQAATTQRYAHLMDDPLRAASESTGARISEALASRRVPESSRCC